VLVNNLELGFPRLPVARVEVRPRAGAQNTLPELQVLAYLRGEDCQVRLQAHKRDRTRRMAGRRAAWLGKAAALAKRLEDLNASVEECSAAVGVRDELVISQQICSQVVGKEDLHLRAVGARATQQAHPGQMKQLHGVGRRYTVPDPLEEV